MAVPVLQTSASNQGDASTLAITKPTDTVDNDLLIAVLCSSNSRTVTTLSGWTLIDSGTNSDCNTYVYSKIASSEGASYTWTFSSTGNNYGWIGRIDGHAGVSFLADNAKGTSSGTTLTFADAAVATTTNLLLFIVGHSQNDGNSNTISTYATTNNNPSSWTELVDLQSTSTASGGLAVAWGNSTGSGSTGNFTAASSDTDTAAVGLLLSIQPPINVTVSPAVIDMTTSVQAPSVTGDANVSPTVVDMTASVQSPTVTLSTPKWNNTAKTSTTWTNESKS